ncbi:hypothetical protein GAYE_SCF63G6669 [Galdieria yellowstonensis]|uniref:Uncharacterized protein n=1 Tax=Galdieria yellowstonensis TaxID=3028027 RepID=A0AAV9IMY4_9RHOD|nr:hypothetical protein GAYE_SCF63G6669 [Galdieria yellowstonensis]
MWPYKKRTIALFLLSCFLLWNSATSDDAKDILASRITFRIPIVLTLIDDTHVEISVATEAPLPTEIPTLIPVTQLPHPVPDNIPFPVAYN